VFTFFVDVPKMYRLGANITVFLPSERRFWYSEYKTITPMRWLTFR